MTAHDEQLSAMRKAIEESQHLAQLEDDWDDEGSCGIKQDTLDRATNWLMRYALYLRQLEKILSTPNIGPGPEGSIDLHWDNPECEILVNISSGAEARVGFYGDDRAQTSLKGSFLFHGLDKKLILWLEKVSLDE